MSRTRTFFTLVFPSMLAGGVLFGSAFTHADSGRGYGDYWPSSHATVVAQADPRPAPRPTVPPMPPMPPMPPPAYQVYPATPPTPPTPPSPAGRHHNHSHSGGGINIQMHDGKVQIDGINDIVASSIKQAQESIRSSNLPPEVKDKLQKRLDKVRAKVQDRMSHLDATDLDQLGEELGKMGEDIGKEMEDFGKEMEKYGDKMSKDAMKNFGKNWGKHWNFDVNSNNSNDSDSDSDSDSDDDSASVDVDDQDDMDDAVRDLGNLSLSDQQRGQIQRLRADSERQIAAAKHQLDQASEALQHQLDNLSASDADIARAIDAVSQQEATIRKARILAWHGARRVLDDAQRRKVVDAARSHKGH